MRLWYLAGSNKLDFISRYIPPYKDESKDGTTVHGAYGPRLFKMRNGVNQIENIIDLLDRKPSSRRAVIQLFNAEDLVGEHAEIPCTTTLQFLIRDDRLHLLTNLRSNDAYLGLPHDIFCFTMLQEIVATKLGRDLGEYRQYVGSMHIYDRHYKAASKYLEEGFQRRDPMPKMPKSDPFDIIPKVLDAERRIRQNETFLAADEFEHSYWADIVRLLQVFHETGQTDRLDELKAELSFQIYRYYLDGRRKMKPRSADRPIEPTLGI